jgi:hypothetical protein
LISILDHYVESFNTPYFIFVRDTVSYLALLGLHFVVCLQPSTLHFTLLEWLILIFFLGRLFMEIDQVINSRTRERNFSEDTSSGGVKKQQTTLLKIMSNYFGLVEIFIDSVLLHVSDSKPGAGCTKPE